LYVGRISREKNLDILAQAFRRIENQTSALNLILVGDGPYRKEMQKELKGSRGLFTGELTGDALAQTYASSDLFVFPSSTEAAFLQMWELYKDKTPSTTFSSKDFSLDQILPLAS